MTGINVLSNTPKVGNKLENTATLKGKETSDSYGNAAAVFGAMLSGRTNLNSNSKGQSSSLAVLDSEEKQSNANPVQGDQNSNGLGSILGYGNLVLPFLTQIMLQSDLPAGKEANSGESMSQGIEDASLANAVFTNVSGVAGKNFEVAMMNLVSLASDAGLESTGMTTLSPQGDNLGITELDKYRQVITNLLVALSGVITDSTPEGNLLGVEGFGTKGLRQELAKIVQGWTTETDGVEEETSALVNSPVISSAGTKDFLQELAKIVQSWMSMTNDAGEETQSALVNSSVASSTGSKDLGQQLTQNGLQQLLKGLAVGSNNGSNPELNTKAANLLAALYPIFIEGAGGAKVPQGVNETLINQLKGIGIDLESIVSAPKETVFLTNVQQISEGTGLQESKFLDAKDIFNEKVNKANSIKSAELFGTKDNQNLSSSTGFGVVANVVPVTLADGKIDAIPVWEQISTVVREQVMNKQQALKELDIQLHPEDLGKIRIFLRWESGQVHLQVQASEAATGQLLQNQLSELRQNLMSQGVNCGSLQMGQGGERQHQPQGDEAQRTFHQSNMLSNEDEDLLSIINPLSLGQDGINRINVTA